MRRLLLLAGLTTLAACSDPNTPASQNQVQAQKAPDTAKVAPAVSDQALTTAPSATPALALNQDPPNLPPLAPGADVAPAQAAAPATVPAAAVDAPPLAQAINQAALPQPGAAAPAGWSVKGVDPALIRAEVLLDRAGFSPGVIDGKDGQNLKYAVAAYAKAKGLTSDGALNDAVWKSLLADGAPTAQGYEITADDVKGPFIGTPPKDYNALAKLPALGFADAAEGLAEKFHMDERLLKALNPGADFGKAGTRIVTAAPHMTPREFTVARIEVDKTNEQVRAYDAANTLVALYPASVGSAERPAPSGTFEVKAVAPRPVYYYDPKRLTFQPEGAKGKLKIAAGPNNPVGSTWIAITVPTYGIHGSPDPTLIGKRQSHGCVRLTNWDAAELGKAVKKGAKVEFVGTETKA